jgi:alkylhydroperoxidase family enzyme
MKRTLLHSVPAFKAYMEWYTLAAELETFIGKRGVYIFSYAISSQNSCLICSTFFRKILRDNGEDPQHLVLSKRDELLWDYGQYLLRDAHNIPEELYKRLAEAFDEQQVVLLTAFAGLMIATNLINTALKVELDEYLQGY